MKERCCTLVFGGWSGTSSRRPGCVEKTCPEEVQEAEAGLRGAGALSSPTFSSLRVSCPSHCQQTERERSVLIITHKGGWGYSGRLSRSYLSPLSMCSRTVGGSGSGASVELSGAGARSLSLLCADAGVFLLSRCTESSRPLASRSLLV